MADVNDTRLKTGKLPAGAPPSANAASGLNRQPIPATGSYKPVEPTPTAKAAPLPATGSYKPVGQLPVARGAVDTGSYKPVGKVPSPKRVSDTGWYGAITSKGPSSRSD